MLDLLEKAIPKDEQEEIKSSCQYLYCFQQRTGQFFYRMQTHLRFAEILKKREK